MRDNNSIKRYIVTVFITFFFAFGIPTTLLTTFYISSIFSNVTEQQTQQYIGIVRSDALSVSTLIEQSSEFVALADRSPQLQEMEVNVYEKSVYTYRQMLDMMNTFCENNALPIECDLYISKSEKVLSTRESVVDVTQYTYQIILAQFRNEKKSTAYYLSGDSLLIFMTRPRYYFSDKEIFIFTLNLSNLFDNKEESPYSIIEKDKGILYGNIPEEEIVLKLIENSTTQSSGSLSMNGYLAWYSVEPYSGMIFARTYDTAEIIQNMGKTIALAISVVLLSFMIIGTVAWVLTKVHTQPVRNLSMQIKELRDVSPFSGKKYTGKQTIFEDISNTLSTLKAENKTFMSSIAQNKKILAEQAIQDVLWGRVPIGVSITDFLAEHEIVFSGKMLLPVLIRTITESFNFSTMQISEISVLAKQLLEESFAAKNVLIGSSILELNQVVLLFNVEAMEQTNVNIEEVFQEAASIIDAQIGVTLHAIVGYSVEDCENLCGQFIDMRRQICEVVANGTEIAQIRPKKQQNNLQSLPYFRASLLNAIRSGSEEKVKDVLQKMREKDDFGDKATRNYLFSIVGSVQAHLFESPAEIPAELLDFVQMFASCENNDIETLYRSIETKLLAITYCFSPKQTGGAANPYVIAAKAYIQQFLEKDLSVTDIADHLGINTSYFSRIFRLDTNMTPHQYIANLRIEHGKELLVSSQFTVKEISNLLGYNDVRAFVRAFKKNVGCTPNEFRSNKLL